ncbi:MAG: PHP domain-containing protein [Methanospirillum sp.]|mgnify:CR=1 FL=1|nr:PHP domain-containing protein [Methanospirillum sp.]
MIACDLHVHTHFSRDGEATVEAVLARAAAAGLAAVAITDHDTLEGARYAARLEDPAVLVIPGVEVSTADGHLIGLGVTQPIPRDLGVLETIDLVHEQGGLSVLPHPFHRLRHGAGLRERGALRAVDAIEVFNSRYIVGTANRRAALQAARLARPAVGGSDAHAARYVGFGWTMVEAEPEIEAILEAVRDGRCYAAGRMTPLRTYTGQSIRSTWRRVRRRIPR